MSGKEPGVHGMPGLVRIVGVGHGVAGRAVDLGDRGAAGVGRRRLGACSRSGVLELAAREVDDARVARRAHVPVTRCWSPSIAWQLPHGSPVVVHSVSGVADVTLTRYSV